MTYFIVFAAAVVLLIIVLVVQRERHWRRRDAAIRALLDGADQLERQLLDCRERMQTLRAMLVDLPEEMTGDADEALAADDKIQAALRDLLQHRLWIKQHALEAGQTDLDNAVGAMRQSLGAMDRQLSRLAEITEALQQAQGR